MALPLRRPTLCALGALTLLLTACPPLDPPSSNTPAELGPIAVGQHLAVGDPDDRSLALVDLDAGRITGLRRVPLGGEPSLVVAAPSPDAATPGAALVLSREARTLDLVDATTGDRRTLALGSPFEGLALTPDGATALAYFPPGTANAVFHNENEIAHVDLDPSTPPDAAVVRRTLASLGGAPRQIAMSPKVGLRRYAFVLSEEHVAVVNLDDPAMPERSVPLVSLTTGGSRTPTGVSFGVADTTLWAIVSTAEASSVYALAITPAAAPEPDGPDFDVRLSQLPGTSPGGAASLVTLDGEDGPALYTLTTSPASGTATLTDVTTATGVTLSIASGLNRLVLFEGEDGPSALTWATSNPDTFHVIDLPAMAARENKAFKTRTTRAAFSNLLPIPRTSRFIALHDSDDQGVSVIDADTDRVTGFGRTGRVQDISIIEMLDRCYILARLGGLAYLVSVDLATLHPEVALVPDGAAALAVLPGADTVAAIAYEVGGLVTLWPLSDTSDAATLVAPGFLLDRLFDRR